MCFINRVVGGDKDFLVLKLESYCVEYGGVFFVFIEIGVGILGFGLVGCIIMIDSVGC